MDLFTIYIFFQSLVLIIDPNGTNNNIQIPLRIISIVISFFGICRDLFQFYKKRNYLIHFIQGSIDYILPDFINDLYIKCKYACREVNSKLLNGNLWEIIILKTILCCGDSGRPDTYVNDNWDILENVITSEIIDYSCYRGNVYNNVEYKYDDTAVKYELGFVWSDDKVWKNCKYVNTRIKNKYNISILYDDNKTDINVFLINTSSNLSKYLECIKDLDIRLLENILSSKNIFTESFKVIDDVYSNGKIQFNYSDINTLFYDYEHDKLLTSDSITFKLADKDNIDMFGNCNEIEIKVKLYETDIINILAIIPVENEELFCDKIKTFSKNNNNIYGSNIVAVVDETSLWQRDNLMHTLSLNNIVAIYCDKNYIICSEEYINTYKIKDYLYKFFVKNKDVCGNIYIVSNKNIKPIVFTNKKLTKNNITFEKNKNNELQLKYGNFQRSINNLNIMFRKDNPFDMNKFTLNDIINRIGIDKMLSFYKPKDVKESIFKKICKDKEYIFGYPYVQLGINEKNLISNDMKKYMNCNHNYIVNTKNIASESKIILLINESKVELYIKKIKNNKSIKNGDDKTEFLIKEIEILNEEKNKIVYDKKYEIVGKINDISFINSSDYVDKYGLGENLLDKLESLRFKKIIRRLY